MIDIAAAIELAARSDDMAEDHPLRRLLVSISAEYGDIWPSSDEPPEQVNALAKNLGQVAFEAYSKTQQSGDAWDEVYWGELSLAGQEGWENAVREQVVVANAQAVPLQVIGGGEPTTIHDWTFAIHEYAKDKGWWDGTPDVAAKLMLMATEVHEAFEEWRNNRELTETYYEDDKPNKPEGVPTELADVVIRILDFCGWAGIDLQKIMAEKHAYNLTRAYRHGGKRV